MCINFTTIQRQNQDKKAKGGKGGRRGAANNRKQKKNQCKKARLKNDERSIGRVITDINCDNNDAKRRYRKETKWMKI